MEKSSRRKKPGEGKAILTLRRATGNDRPALIGLLKKADMGYVEPAGDYMIALAGETIAGCGRLEDHGDIAMLRPLVVDESYRKKGVGRYIIENIIPDDKPTVVAARGESVPFYNSIGFTRADWRSVSDEQREECSLCPDRTECKPQPMIYIPESHSK